MPVAIKPSLKPLTSVVSKYITSHRARVQAQTEANGTASGPTGAEVDAQVASTLSRKQGASLLPEIPTIQVDAEGRTLGLEDPNQPSLKDDPNTALRATARPLIVPTSSVSDSALLQEVSEVTYGLQTSIPLFSTPAKTDETSLVDVNQYGFVDPRLYGGTSFDLVGNGLHEPLNVIISSHSSPVILTRKGFQSYCRSLDFDKECLGLHAGGFQKAYIDPRGWRDQEFIYREVYTPLDHVFGTCIESLVGGNHIRAWQQQGSGAWFLATSREEDASKNHMIIPNGYNIGRNQLVQQALGKAKDGKTSFMWTKYRTEVQFVAGLMPQGVQGVNHDIAVDGLTAVLTVTVLPEKGLFGAKSQGQGSAQTVVVNDDEVEEEGGETAASGVVSTGAEKMEDGKKEEKRLRRTSLAKRFSLGLAPRQNEAGSQDKNVWQKLRNMAAPKHQPASPTTDGAATNDTLVAAAEAEGLPSSVDSASTAAEMVEPLSNTNANKVQPSGLVAAPAIAA
ncbi:uncharacterized protein UTRI_10445_B [Ustilago trichophora]|uniref:Uncharacterized protein n=1 Tax=Ustilago trichophora TaxID=86804 RepID=A0A5C3E9X2_9BASI|nr:uncharacterized protein UTRI_10445_B [Ustilago trichophora]